MDFRAPLCFVSLSGMERIRGLDCIRFISAAWVMLSHSGIHLYHDAPVPPWIRLLVNNTFCGVAAVIVFFVISGYCIHFPQRHSLTISSLTGYGLRRSIRILLPLLAALSLCALLQTQGFAGANLEAILWSIIAESIYYLLYPALLAVRRKIGWRMLIELSCIGWLMLIALEPRPEYTTYHVYGTLWTWLVGLPCWLLGCLLAERTLEVGEPLTLRKLWMLRLFIWAASMLCSMANFHSPLRYVWSLNIFALTVFFWLEQEIRYYNRQNPSMLLERAGAGAYSLYLVHYPILVVLASYFPGTGSILLGWIGVFAASFLFYKVIEQPSHHLARSAGTSVEAAKKS